MRALWQGSWLSRRCQGHRSILLVFPLPPSRMILLARAEKREFFSVLFVQAWVSGLTLVLRESQVLFCHGPPGSLWWAWSRQAFMRTGVCAWLLGNRKLPLPCEGDQPETLMLRDPFLTVKNSRGKRLFPCGSPLINSLIASQLWKCMGGPYTEVQRTLVRWCALDWLTSRKPASSTVRSCKLSRLWELLSYSVCAARAPQERGDRARLAAVMCLSGCLGGLR